MPICFKFSEHGIFYCLCYLTAVSYTHLSIDRHYVRPIVRGKETKSVEFGAKVNNIQIDGISFIEHLSFKAFNEGIRLKEASALKSHITRSQE